MITVGCPGFGDGTISVGPRERKNEQALALEGFAYATPGTAAAWKYSQSLGQLVHLLPYNFPGRYLRFVFHNIAECHPISLQPVGPDLAGGNEARAGGDLR